MKKKILISLAVVTLLVATAFAFQSAHITTNTTTTVSSRPGYLSHLKINGGTMGTISVWDNNSTTGVMVDNIVSPLAGQHYVYDRDLVWGLKVVTADNTNLTVFFR